jgi:hypothetical protein
MPNADEDDWVHLRFYRDPAHLHTHRIEVFEGAVFVSHRIYGANGQLESVHLIRADLVRAVDLLLIPSPTGAPDQ